MTGESGLYESISTHAYFWNSTARGCLAMVVCTSCLWDSRSRWWKAIPFRSPSNFERAGSIEVQVMTFDREGTGHGHMKHDKKKE